MKSHFNHNRVYGAILTVFALVTASTAGGLFNWSKNVGGPVGHLPEWAVPWMAALNLAYAIGIIVTLGARRFKPGAGRVLTRVLNWVLLPAVPGGTIIGLYGLLCADRENR